MTLEINPFKRGDEPVWVEIQNQIYEQQGGWRRAITIEEMLEYEKRPNFDFKGRFIVRVSSKPIGIINAHVDAFREEKKGFISFGLIRKYLDRGLESELIEFATRKLAEREMDIVQGWCSSGSDLVNVFEQLGFKLARLESDMEIDLAEITLEIEENKEVSIKAVDRDSDYDIQQLNSLNNECFKEHFDFRPMTIEETRYSLLKKPQFQSEIFFAVLKSKTVGFIGISIDEKYNLEKNTKSGYIFDIGVLKTHRRKGIGTRLILHGLCVFRSKGMKKARLDVDDFNSSRAMELYQKIGFKVIRKWAKYEKNL